MVGIGVWVPCANPDPGFDISQVHGVDEGGGDSPPPARMSIPAQVGLIFAKPFFGSFLSPTQFPKSILF